MRCTRGNLDNFVSKYAMQPIIDSASCPILVYTTFEHKKDVVHMAKLLLEKRLVACAQISSPVSSLYWWQETIEETQEYVLVLKTMSTLFTQIQDCFDQHHPYQLPELIAVAAAHISPQYLRWLEEAVHQ